MAAAPPNLPPRPPLLRLPFQQPSFHLHAPHLPPPRGHPLPHPQARKLHPPAADVVVPPLRQGGSCLRLGGAGVECLGSRVRCYA